MIGHVASSCHVVILPGTRYNRAADPTLVPLAQEEGARCWMISCTWVATPVANVVLMISLVRFDEFYHLISQHVELQVLDVTSISYCYSKLHVKIMKELVSLIPHPSVVYVWPHVF